MPSRTAPASGGSPTPEADRAYRGAVSGADAYRCTRAAVRIERGVLRVGNRFVPADRYREIGFLAIGRAAISQGYALVDALGDSLTQGFLAGPDEVPSAIPFQHRRVADGRLGTPEAGAVSAAALELAAGLGPKDLLIVALSPGALAPLAEPPPGMGAPAYREFLAAARRAGASGSAIEELVRTTAGGSVAGRLAAAGPAELLTVVVDRSGSPEQCGGGPTRALDPPERERSRAALVQAGLWERAPPEIRAALDRGGALVARSGPRPIAVTGPADALQGSGDSLSDAKWWSRLGALSIPGGPLEVAEAFHARFEEVLRGVPKSREARKGIAVFAASPLDCPDGEGEGEALARLLPALRAKTQHPELRLAVFRTAGARPGDVGLGGAEADAPSEGARPIEAYLAGRPGVTDVGPVLMALRPEPPPK